MNFSENVFLFKKIEQKNNGRSQKSASYFSLNRFKKITDNLSRGLKVG